MILCIPFLSQYQWCESTCEENPAAAPTEADQQRSVHQTQQGLNQHAATG